MVQNYVGLMISSSYMTVKTIDSGQEKARKPAWFARRRGRNLGFAQTAGKLSASIASTHATTSVHNAGRKARLSKTKSKKIIKMVKQKVARKHRKSA